MPSKVKVCAPLSVLSRNVSLTGLVASRPEVGGGASRQSMVFRLSRNTVITILVDSPKKKTLHRAPPRFVAGRRAEDRRDHELCKHSFTQRVVFKINSWPPLFLSFSSTNKRIVKLGFQNGTFFQCFNWAERLTFLDVQGYKNIRTSCLPKLPLGWAGLGCSKRREASRVFTQWDWQGSTSHPHKGLETLQTTIDHREECVDCSSTLIEYRANSLPACQGSSWLLYVLCVVIFHFTNKKLRQQEVKNLTHTWRGHWLQRDNMKTAVRWAYQLQYLGGESFSLIPHAHYAPESKLGFTKTQLLLTIHKAWMCGKQSFPGCIGLLFIWSYLT